MPGAHAPQLLLPSSWRVVLAHSSPPASLQAAWLLASAACQHKWAAGGRWGALGCAARLAAAVCTSARQLPSSSSSQGSSSSSSCSSQGGSSSQRSMSWQHTAARHGLHTSSCAAQHTAAAAAAHEQQDDQHKQQTQQQQQQQHLGFKPGARLAGGRYRLVKCWQGRGAQSDQDAADAPAPPPGAAAAAPTQDSSATPSSSSASSQQEQPAASSLPAKPPCSVWEGLETSTSTRVVIKCYEAGDPQSFAAGVREAALHAAAGRHPNLVPLLDAFEHRSPAGRHALLVTEPAGRSLPNPLGRSLADIDNEFMIVSMLEALLGGHSIRDEGLFGLGAPGVLKHIARNVLQALDHLHSRGLVYTALSLDSLVLDKEFKSGSELSKNSVVGYLYKILRPSRRPLSETLEEMHQQEEEHLRGFSADNIVHEHTFERAVIKLADLGSVVPYGPSLLPGLPPAASDAAEPDAAQLLRGESIGVVAPLDTTASLLDRQQLWRPPEEVLRMPSYVAPGLDLWKLGCLLFKVATHEEVFAEADVLQRSKARGNHKLEPYSLEPMLLFAQSEVLGDPPRDFVRRSPHFETYFLGRASSDPRFADTLILANMMKVTRTPLDSRLGGLLDKQLWPARMDPAEYRAFRQSFADFLSLLLRWDPATRPSAAQMLQHKWLAPKPQTVSDAAA